MIDETFGEVEYCEDLGFIAHKDIEFGGSKSNYVTIPSLTVWYK